ncbi:DUF1211 domain-containing protein [Mycobacterium sp. Y57]|uniref:TMEM175 family protein n=1 Tax=Mycolicibacterium xanthum TaxID=2796469 RepID=UPI001C842356|nr:TMEM175 family protein [Mycolicibacterium xanthum]MBX7432797.1 DUF1211 domain-containing protein [Mycolicibacterium xanthum]
MRRVDLSLPTGRLEAFSDGVYAIVITLLVLELDVPASPDRLLSALAENWPSFLGYLVSFAFIGASWVAHVKLTRCMSACDDVFVGLNLIKLLFVSFLPFTTSLMANHLTGAGQRPAAVLFGLNLVMANAMLTVLAAYSLRAKGLAEPERRADLRRLVRTQWPSTVLLVAATVVAAFFPAAAVIFYLAISALMLIRPLVRIERTIRVGRQSR